MLPMQRTILHADDNENDGLLLRLAFKKAGLPDRIVQVYDGEQAIDYLSGEAPCSDRVLQPLPHLLLLDLKMPRMDGFDVLAWLNGARDLKELPVVVLSSSAELSDSAKARELGARDYLVKPAELEEWVELVQKLHATWLSKDLERL